MKKIWLIRLICAATLWVRLDAAILPVLPHPNADELSRSAFVQTFAGLNIVSSSNGIGTTEPFFDNVPIPGTITSILGSFQAFDPLGDPTSFDILGVHVTQAGSTFTPPFGSFNFAGESSVTFTDVNTFDTVTFNSGDPTLAFTVPSGPFQFTIDTTLSEGSSITFQIAEPPEIPEPETFFLMGAGLALLTWRGVKRKVV
jgi:hypothetical protein